MIQVTLIPTMKRFRLPADNADCCAELAEFTGKELSVLSMVFT